MENRLTTQDPGTCPLIKLPSSLIAHTLAYIVTPVYIGGFYRGKTKALRNFLMTCKHYHANKELTQTIIFQFAQRYKMPRAFVFVPLYLSTPTALVCLKEWLHTTTEISIIGGDTAMIASQDKIASLNNFLHEASTGLVNPDGLRYTPKQRQHLINQFLALKSMAQQIA